MRLLDRGTARGPVDELVLFDNAPPALPLPEDKRLRGRHRRHRRPRHGARADRARAPTRCFTSPRSSAARPRPTPISATGSISTAPAPCSMPAARSGTAPRLIFASSLAVYGGVLPPEVGEETALTPQSSYGAQKAIGELLVNDYSRKGFVDGRGAAPADRRRASRSAEPRRLDLRLVDDPRAADRQRRGVPGVARHGHGAGLAAPHRRRAGACARPARRRARREPVIAAAGVLGVGRRDGGGVAPRRRRGGLRAHPVAARPADPGDHLELAASACGAARRGARLRPRQRHRRGDRRPLSRTTCRCSASSPAETVPRIGAIGQLRRSAGPTSPGRAMRRWRPPSARR